MPPLKRPSLKEKIFAQEYVKTKGNGTKAALKAYDVKNKKAAGSLAVVTLDRPRVQNYIAQIMKEASYNPVNSVRNVMSIEERASKKNKDFPQSLKASEMLLKLNGLLIDRSQSVSLSASLDSMAPADLLALKRKYDKLLKD